MIMSVCKSVYSSQAKANVSVWRGMELIRMHGSSIANRDGNGAQACGGCAGIPVASPTGTANAGTHWRALDGFLQQRLEC
jgi:hypothetical protein